MIIVVLFSGVQQVETTTTATTEKHMFSYVVN